MKGAALAGLAALALTLSVPAAASDFSKKESPIVLAVPPPEVPDGERLTYQVRWLGIPIGTGEIHIENAKAPDGSEAVQITATAKANEFLAKFYPVSDTLKSLARPRTYHVLRSEKDLREGRYRADERVDFDYASGVARWQSFKNGSKKDIPLEGPCHDPLSAFYWFRTLALEPGQTVKTTVNADEKNWDFAVKVTKTERLELRGWGTFDTFVAEPKAKFKGVLVDRGRAWVHFTADARRLPLRIKLETPYGPVLGIIESVPEKV